jgi:oligopeptide/dipeptide ABC transporter ATP-binding protein
VSELLVVDGLEKHFLLHSWSQFRRRTAAVRAVDGISFTVNQGETLAIVGESGCGKTTLARCITRLLRPTAGTVTFDGRDITELAEREMRPIRRDLAMVFQDPHSSLSPRKRIGFTIGEALKLHRFGTDAEIKKRVRDLLDLVGLNPEHYNRYPHQFSGGQRQRIGIARALSVSPKLVVCDEPVSALDVSVQAQILNLLKDLQKELNLTYVIIAHDLNVVRYIADRVLVMYLGHAVEIASRDELYSNPKHPYSGALLSSVPLPDPDLGRERQRVVLQGDVPNPVLPPSGCWFHPRCPRFHPGHCDIDTPQLVSRGSNHLTACHYPLERWPMREAELRMEGGAGSGGHNPGPAAGNLRTSANVPVGEGEPAG